MAKALGMSLVAMATLGLGMSARAQSRSMMPWRSGASSRDTSRPRMANRAILSEKKYWAKSRRPAITTTATMEVPTLNSTVMNTA